MLIIKEKVITRKVKHELNTNIVKKINKRLDILKKESTWPVEYSWEKGKRKLKVKTDSLYWDIVFVDHKVDVFVEYSLFLKPFFSQYRKHIVKILNEEIDLLN